MKALVLQKDNKVALQDVPEPTIKKNDDVLIRVTTAAICGSDIHAKHGLIPGVGPGTLLGHEFVGVVEEAGPDVKRFKKGDRVSVPATAFCRRCPSCNNNGVQYCENGGVWGGGEIFGKGLDGAQTTYVRAPFADACLVPIPDSVSDRQAVFVGDVFITGYHAAREGNIRTGDTVVLFGCGPIGLGALISAWQFGPNKILAVDVLDNRLALAEQYGATPIDARKSDAVAQVRQMTGGLGADVAIEAIGNPATFQQALQSVRRGGTVSVVGLFPGSVQFPLMEMSFYGVKLSMGLANPATMPQLMALIEAERVNLDALATHTFPLSEAVEAYDMVEHHKEKCLKVLLKP